MSAAEVRLGPLTDEFLVAVARFGHGRKVGLPGGGRVRWVKGLSLVPLRRVAGSLEEHAVKAALKKASASILDVFLKAEGANFCSARDVLARGQRGVSRPLAEVFAIPPRRNADAPPVAFVCRNSCWVFVERERERVEAFVGAPAQLVPLAKAHRVAWCAQQFSRGVGDARRAFHDRMMALRDAHLGVKTPTRPPSPPDSTRLFVPSRAVSTHAFLTHALPDIRRMYAVSSPICMAVVPGGKAVVGTLVSEDMLAVFGEIPEGVTSTDFVTRRSAFAAARVGEPHASWVPLALRTPIVRVGHVLPLGAEGASLVSRVQGVRKALLESMSSASDCTPKRMRDALCFLSLRGEDLRAAATATGVVLEEHPEGGATVTLRGNVRACVTKGGDGSWRMSRLGAIMDGAELEDVLPPFEKAWEALVTFVIQQSDGSAVAELWRSAVEASPRAESDVQILGALVSPVSHPAVVDSRLEVAGPLTALRIEWSTHGAMSFSWCGAGRASEKVPKSERWACALRVGNVPIWDTDCADNVMSAEALALATAPFGSSRRGARVDVSWGSKGALSDVCLALRCPEHGMVVVRLAVV